MKIQINYGDVDHSDALDEQVRERVESTLKHHADRITRIEVHLHDENSHKSGPRDRRCVIEGRLAGQQPLVVEESSEDLYTSIHRAAAKLGRAVEHKIGKLASK